MLDRRTALLVSLAATAACAGQEPPPPTVSLPLSYTHLTPIRIAAASLDIVEPQPGPAVFAMPPVPVTPAEALTMMARDRITPLGSSRTARFVIGTARLDRQPASSGGLFSRATESLACTLRCRLEIVSPEGDVLGFAEAEVRRVATVPASTEAERATAATRIVQAAMADMNVEFEYQVRRNLQPFLLGADAVGPAPAPGVEREALPQS